MKKYIYASNVYIYLTFLKNYFYLFLQVCICPIYQLTQKFFLHTSFKIYEIKFMADDQKI